MEIPEEIVDACAELQSKLENYFSHTNSVPPAPFQLLFIVSENIDSLDQFKEFYRKQEFKPVTCVGKQVTKIGKLEKRVAAQCYYK